MKYQKGFSPYRFKDNPLEKEFADGWIKTNKEGHILEYLLSPDNKRHHSTITEKDEETANAVIQWLGSPVGRSFLARVQGK